MRQTSLVPALLAAGLLVATAACSGVLPQSATDPGAAAPLPVDGGSSTTITGGTEPPATLPGDEPGTTTVPAPTQDPAVNQALVGYTTWQDPGYHSTDDRNLEADEWVEVTPDSGRQQVTCTPSPLPIPARELDEFPAFGFLGDNVLPGLVVEGRSVETGDLRVLALDRAPFTLRSSLASANPTVVVDDPNSGSVAEAVATLKRDADPRLGGIDVTAADINYGLTETHSFEQSSLELGVSLRYRNRLVSAGLETDYSQQRSVERHTLTVRMVQRQLTLSVVDDVIDQPGDFFAPTVSLADVQALENQGVIAADSPPMLIDRVDYGRVMYFTMSSTQVSSAEELRVAIEAVKGRYEGSAEVDAGHLQTINQAEIEMVAYGGDQELANQAIRSGDISQFFGPANPTAAAPLTFGLRTLSGTPVTLSETADVNQLTCQRTAEPYGFALNIDRVQGRLRVFVNGAEVADVRDDNPLIGSKVDGTATVEGGRLNDQLDPGLNTVRLRYTNLGCDNRFRVRVHNGPAVAGSSSIETFNHPSPGCPSEGDLTMEFTIDTTTGVVAAR